MENKIAFELTAAELQTINDAFKAIIETLEPQAVVLTDQDRRTLPKMADGTSPFVKKALNYMTTNPEFTPNFVNKNDLAIDLSGYELGNLLLASAYQITRILEDISILSGSEAYVAALAYFNNAKFQAKNNQRGAKLVYEDLQTRFLSKPGGGSTPPPPAAGK